jgi:ABC-type lipoprotein export system ATPase subunit
MHEADHGIQSCKRRRRAHHVREQPGGLHEAQEAEEQQEQRDGELHGGRQQRHAAARGVDRVNCLAPGAAQA